MSCMINDGYCHLMSLQWISREIRTANDIYPELLQAEEPQEHQMFSVELSFSCTITLSWRLRLLYIFRIRIRSKHMQLVKGVGFLCFIEFIVFFGFCKSFFSKQCNLVNSIQPTKHILLWLAKFMHIRKNKLYTFVNSFCLESFPTSWRWSARCPPCSR